MFRSFALPLLLTLALLLPIAPAMAEIPMPVDRRATLVLMYDALRQAAPDLEFAMDEEDMSVTLATPDGGSFQLAPDNLDLRLHAENTAAGRQAVLDEHIRNVLGSVRRLAAGTEDEAPLDPAAIMPVVRVDQGEPVETADGPGLFYRPYLPGLVVYWVEDMPQTTASISLKRATAAGLDMAGLDTRALENLRLRTAMAQEQQIEDTGGIIAVELDGYYESSILLLNDYWQARTAGGKRLVAFAPNRNFLFYLVDPAPEVLANAQKLAEGLALGQPYPITATPLHWTDSGWRLLAE